LLAYPCLDGRFIIALTIIPFTLSDIVWTRVINMARCVPHRLYGANERAKKWVMGLTSYNLEIHWLPPNYVNPRYQFSQTVFHMPVSGFHP